MRIAILTHSQPTHSLGPLSTRQRNAILMAFAGGPIVAVCKQQRATVDPPAKRHSNGVCWLANYSGPLLFPYWELCTTYLQTVLILV